MLKIVHGPTQWLITGSIEFGDADLEDARWTYDYLIESDDPMKKYVKFYREEFSVTSLIERQLKF